MLASDRKDGESGEFSEELGPSRPSRKRSSKAAGNAVVQITKSAKLTEGTLPLTTPKSVISVDPTGLLSFPLTAYAFVEKEFLSDSRKPYHRLILAELSSSESGKYLDVGAGIRLTSDSEPAAYLLRKEFFSVQNNMIHDSVCIGEKNYVIVLSADVNCEYCLAVQGPRDNTPPTFQATEDSTAGNVTVSWGSYCTHVGCQSCIAERRVDVALEHLHGGGRLLWKGGWGGVWAGFLHSGPNMTGNDEPVVIKRFLYVKQADPRDSLTDNPTDYRILRGIAHPNAKWFISHLGSEVMKAARQGKSITSADLAEGFALKEREGGKENPMREVELMAHIAREIPNHADFFSTLQGFGVSTTDLYVLTKELDTPSLFLIKKARANAGLSLLFCEDVARPIVKRVLRALQLLHKKSIAHWDIKVDNTAFRIKPELADAKERAALVQKLLTKEALADEDLCKLDAMVIDFGQAVWDSPQTFTSSSSSASIATTANLQTRTSPRSVHSVGDVSPVPAIPAAPLTPVSAAAPPNEKPWVRSLAIGRSPPGGNYAVAPEHWKNDGSASSPKKVDMWQVGVMLFGMLTNLTLCVPRLCNSGNPLCVKVPCVKCVKTTVDQFFTPYCHYAAEQREEFLINRAAFAKVTLTPDCRAFLTQLLQVDPVARMSVDDALDHSWLQ